MIDKVNVTKCVVFFPVYGKLEKIVLQRLSCALSPGSIQRLCFRGKGWIFMRIPGMVDRVKRSVPKNAELWSSR